MRIGRSDIAKRREGSKYIRSNKSALYFPIFRAKNVGKVGGVTRAGETPISLSLSPPPTQLLSHPSKENAQGRGSCDHQSVRECRLPPPSFSESSPFLLRSCVCVSCKMEEGRRRWWEEKEEEVRREGERRLR